MSLEKAKKKLIGVVIFGALSVLSDQFIFRGPPEATAAPAEALLIEKSDATTAGASPRPTSRPVNRGWGAQQVGTRVANSYEKTGRPVVKNDPFHVPVERAVVVEARAASAPVERAAVVFARGHNLKAILSSGRRGAALVNDKLLREGDTIDGWRVVGIASNSVLLDRNGEKLKMALSDTAEKLQVVK